MVKSMTGFGKSETKFEQKRILIEIKSLNSKQADISMRLPNAFSSKEVIIRSVLAKKLKRGKVFCQITVENLGAEPPVVINKELAVKYIEELKAINKLADIPPENDFLPVVTRLPEVIVNKSEDISDREFENVKSCLLSAIDEVDKFRLHEGELLADDFRQRINKIASLLQNIQPLEKERIVKIRQRIETDLQNYAAKLNIDENRFEQELIFYLEKLDITEEKIRLTKHIDYFIETLEASGDEKGKKLGFVLQEIGREINTIGSKANDAGIQKIVVQMKDELEKVKEQMMNIL